MSYYLTGGFLAGYRTYILAGLGVISAIGMYATGDMNADDALKTVWQSVLSLSVGTARAALKD